MKRKILLQRMEQDRPVGTAEDSEFLYGLKRALLLSLRQRGLLTEPQSKSALEALRKQYPEGPEKGAKAL